MKDLAIVVPSRGRPENMAHLLGLVPTAIICVDEREVEAYAPHVPKKQLLPHPPSKGAPAARNWIQELVEAPILVMIDDDLQGVECTVGSRRYITNPEEILAVIENAAQVCEDIGLAVFCFSRTLNTMVIRPNERPIVPVQQTFGCVGMMGAARHRKYDTKLKSRADLDWGMRALLHDRALYADVRFYFDFGMSFSGSGGNSGLVTPEAFAASTKVVAQRWGKHLSFGGKKGPHKNVNVMGGTPTVSRTNKAAQR